MELVFLGTSAGRPTRERNVSAILLDLSLERQSLWLFDCGEATQHQMLRARIHPAKLEKIFITHLHGDHLFGLPGLLGSRSMNNCTSPLTIYGPKGIRLYLETVLTLSDSRVTYPLEIVEIIEGEIFTDETFSVSATALRHRIESYGYRITGNGSLFGKIIAIFGDTQPTERADEVARDASVIVHEATMEIALAEKAYLHGHSTTEDVANLAKRCGAKRLIITHFSSRYSLDSSAKLLTECQAIFPATEMATDFARFKIE